MQPLGDLPQLEAVARDEQLLGTGGIRLVQRAKQQSVDLAAQPLQREERAVAPKACSVLQSFADQNPLQDPALRRQAL